MRVYDVLPLLHPVADPGHGEDEGRVGRVLAQLAAQLPPSSSGLELANWYWRVVRRFVSERFGLNLSRRVA